MAHHDGVLAAPVPRTRGRLAPRRVAHAALLHGGGWLLSAGALFVLLFPVLVMLSTSVKTIDEVYQAPPVWIPRTVAWWNFLDIWAHYPLGTYMRNSLIIGLGTTLLNLTAAI